MTDSNSKIPNPQSKMESLLADLGPESEALVPVVRRLDSWPAPRPTALDTARLIATLKAELPISSYRSQTTSPLVRVSNLLSSSLLLLRAQFRLIREEIWLASALVLALGVLVTLATADARHTPETLPFVFIAPVVAAVGIACLYGPGADPALEIELAAPTSPRTVLLARLTLLFGFNLGMCLLTSLLISRLLPFIPITALITAWLAPMTFLSALALLLAVVFFDPLAGITASLLLWAWQVFRTIGGMAPLPFLAGLPNLLAADLRLWLFIVAIPMGLIALWAAGRDERWSRPLA